MQAYTNVIGVFLLCMGFSVFGQDTLSMDTLPEATIPIEATVYPYRVKNILGDSVSLSAYNGKVLLFVNTASFCGHTGQYAGLQKLYEKYRSRGLEILAFPSNDFADQEPGNDDEILNFCRSKYQVTFQLFSKVHVRGKDAIPLYRFLVDESRNMFSGEPIHWNFQKILVGRNGMVIRAFLPTMKPDNAELAEAIENALRN